MIEGAALAHLHSLTARKLSTAGFWMAANYVESNWCPGKPVATLVEIEIYLRERGVDRAADIIRECAEKWGK